MRRLFLLLVALSLGACGTTEINQKSPVNMKMYFNEKSTPQSMVIKPEQKIKNKLPMLQEGLTFIDIIRKEGVPTENIIPRKKEQLAIYKKDETVSVYYFKENELFSKKDYSTQEMKRIEAKSEYPSNIFKDLGAI
ncbi:MAG: hypothetical protein ACSLFC_11285 [Desulfuromonadales bacterium]